MLLFAILACTSTDDAGASLSVTEGSLRNAEAAGGDAGDGTTGGADSGASDDEDSQDDTDVADADLVRQTPGSLHLPDLAGKNIVVLHIDTLRADHLAAYGYFRNTLPRLSARQWLAVDGEIASSSWTLPSTVSFFTGLDAATHDVRYLDQGKPNHRLDKTTFAERLTNEGYATGVITGNLMASSQTKITDGFSYEVANAKVPTSARINSVELADAALYYVDGLPADQPFMLHIQPMDLHSPLVPPSAYQGTYTDDIPFKTEGATMNGQEDEIKNMLLNAHELADRTRIVSALNGAYDESMLGLDEGLDRVISGLESRGMLADTVVILTADHGEELDDADDAILGHGGNLRESTIHIPMMILSPELAPGSATCRMRNYDVWPTLFSAMGLGVPEGLDGVDLAEGCPAVAASAVWDMTGRLMLVSADGGRSKLTADCPIGGVRRGINLGRGYEAHEAGDPDTISDADTVEANIAADILDIEAHNPQSECHIE